MVVVACSIEGCTYKTEDASAAIVVQLLSLHALQHTNRAPITASTGPKLTRPTIDSGVQEETWNNFLRRWETFRLGSGISEDAAPVQLFQCASESLGDLLLKADPRLTTRTTVDVLKAMKELAVIPVARGVTRAELLQMKQSGDEPVRTFAARVRGKAETCGFVTSATCACGKDIQADYTEEVILDVILSGLSDIDIRREALSKPDIHGKPINEVISFIEGREMARNATPLSSVSALSSYAQSKQTKPAAVPNQKVPCPSCKKPFLKFKERPSGGFNKNPYKMCIDCWRADKKRPKETECSNIDLGAHSVDIRDSEPVLQISVIGSTKIQHPKVEIHVSAAGSGDPVPVMAVADTGAMANVWGLGDFVKSGLCKQDLQPTRVKIKAANGQYLDIHGQFNATISAKTPDGDHINCICPIFIANSVNGFFLSKDTMCKLYILDNNFPTVGACLKKNYMYENYDVLVNELIDDSQVRDLFSGCIEPSANDPCKCPLRTSVPQKPKSLPFPPTPENIPKMKQWLLNHYGSSTFNTCPHRALPCMTGPPMEIHIDEKAPPKVCNTPATVPLHWQDRVYEDLLRDEALGVIERVPVGVPVTWCHRMVVTRKHDGTPRRTVDLSPLNKFCTRETFPAEAPFHLARRVPGQTWKSVTDAWNGYHSVPLRESDRHLTTFITPYGKWRYTRAPQGFLSSGDGYNKRFDAVLADFTRKERCVDDTIHFDENLEEHWWRTIDLLHTMGSAGIVLNPDKFQFSQRRVDFAGFRISENSIEPLPKYIEAIRSFPRPKSIKDIRSWFGLVNQVSNYGQLREFMALFRPFLSPSYKFFWSEVLEKAFEESKEHIIQAIRTGVEIFDKSRKTCLRPDWSNQGIGYFLLQKHCACHSDLPECCPDGWRITLAGSRFLSGAEERYAAIEGEALAIAWGLEQTRYFTMGCENLVVVTDHKPLVKIFGDRTLDEIPNTRLFRLKQRTLPWHFHTAHMPGKTNHAADAASRYPAQCLEASSLTVGDYSELLMNAAISRETGDLIAVSWSLLADETKKDSILSKLMSAIEHGFATLYDEISDYVRYRDSLYITDGVILYQDRVVVPLSLRPCVLNSLHSAHQGVSAMQSRAQAVVFWPGMSLDIQDTRSRCRDCNRNAPSQAQIPSEPAVPPLTPFEQIFADYFEFGGHHFLVAGDRLSGWCEIFSTPSGSSISGARGLIKCLRSLFSIFGVPIELSSDGGPEFSASVTREFLGKWNVRHRISSAYFPQSNGRAEVAVKATKRLLRSNIGPNGTLDSDNLLRALLQSRNTPDPDCSLSPAQIIFGRPLRDSLSFINRLEKFSNPHVRSVWRDAWAQKESALRTRFAKSSETLSAHSKSLQPIDIGEKCFVQNQTGNCPNKWERTGTIMEKLDHDQYIVKIDGSGRLTKRNRRFLRVYKPATMAMENSPSVKSWDSQITKERSFESSRPTTTEPLPETISQKPVSLVNPSEPMVPHEIEGEMHVEEETAPTDNDNQTQKIPAALKRLLPHNSDGLRENIISPEEGSRRTRRHPID